MRLSQGSAIALGLAQGKMDAAPTTCYIMLGPACRRNCGFCAQARDVEESGNALSRVSWPEFVWKDIIRALGRSQAFKRVCFQTLSYQEMVSELSRAVKGLSNLGIKCSAAVEPLDQGELLELHFSGLDRIGIALDAACEEIFTKVKGGEAGNPYSWEEHLKALELAASIFPNSTTTHIIVGLGEDDEDLKNILLWCRERNILPGLFAYTPLPGTSLDLQAPPISRYRAVQAARWLILEEKSVEVQNGRFRAMEGIEQVPASAFQTSGCPDCNRPFYNERPTGPMYNFPRPLTSSEHREAMLEVRQYLRWRGIQ